MRCIGYAQCFSNCYGLIL